MRAVLNSTSWALSLYGYIGENAGDPSQKPYAILLSSMASSLIAVSRPWVAMLEQALARHEHPCTHPSLSTSFAPHPQLGLQLALQPLYQPRRRRHRPHLPQILSELKEYISLLLKVIDAVISTERLVADALKGAREQDCALVMRGDTPFAICVHHKKIVRW